MDDTNLIITIFKHLEKTNPDKTIGWLLIMTVNQYRKAKFKYIRVADVCDALISNCYCEYAEKLNKTYGK